MDLAEASELLKLHLQTILQRACSGDIPAAKPGKCWVFIEEDLIKWLRSHYTRLQQDVGQGGNKICCLKDPIVNIGGIALPH
jgi:excisionase family DNA binding protein